MTDMRFNHMATFQGQHCDLSTNQLKRTAWLNKWESDGLVHTKVPYWCASGGQWNGLLAVAGCQYSSTRLSHCRHRMLTALICVPASVSRSHRFRTWWTINLANPALRNLSALSIPCIIWVDTTCSQSLTADCVTIHTQSGNTNKTGIVRIASLAPQSNHGHNNAFCPLLS